MKKEEIVQVNIKNTVASVVAMIVVFIVVLGIVGVSTYNDARNGVIHRESALNAQYLDNQNELSGYILTVKEALGVADVASSKVDSIISNAIQGRNQGESGGVGEAQFVIQAVHEAYPDISGVNMNYQNVQNAIIGGREAFKNQQTKLLDMIREYDTYRQSGIVHSMVVGWVGAPTQDLKAQVGDTVYTGAEALEKMRTIIQTPDSLKAYESGRDEGLDTKGLSEGSQS